MFNPHRSSPNRSEQSLFTQSGQRKYLNADERGSFHNAAQLQSDDTKLFGMLLLYSGCRLSEALNLTAECILVTEGVVLIRSLKKRDQMAVRQVPLPRDLLTKLRALHPINSNVRLWPWGRTWAWMQIKKMLLQADVVGPHANPRGLRHGFGVHAIQRGIPLNMVQRWLGHADIKTTAIYTDAVGPEEQALAKRMWN